MNIVLDLDLTLRGLMVSPVLYIIMCPRLYAYLDACVCVWTRGGRRYKRDYAVCYIF